MSFKGSKFSNLKISAITLIFEQATNKKSKKVVDKKEIWKGRGHKTTHSKSFSYFGSQLNEKDFSIKELYRFDHGYLKMGQKNRFESIFKESHSKKVFNPFLFNQKRKRILKKLTKNNSQRNKKKKSENFILDVFKLKFIYEDVSNKSFEYISKTFNMNEFFLKKSAKY